MRRPKRKGRQSQTPLTLSPRRVEEPDAAASASAAEGEGEAVLSLDADSFDDAVAKHPFVVALFYAPWCRQSKKLAPEYEKAARLLSKHDPPIVLVKVDGNDDKNWPLATGYKIEGFPTVKIFRNYGNNIQEYKGPREAEGIVEYLKKQVGPASKEIKSPEDAAVVLTSDETIYIVGVFAEFSGTEFSNFMEVAEKLRSDYDFAHALHANYLPRGGDVMVERPFVRLFKPFDELVAESKEFDVAALEKFIDTSSTPRVVTLDKSPDNHSYLLKFYESSAPKDKEIKFLIGDTEASQGALQYFGLKKDQAPLILIRHGESMFLKNHIEADQIVSWLKEYFECKLTPFKKSQPIPEVNNEPIKVVVADNLHDVVFKSGKNVLIEFYAPWCRDCKKLAPILEEAATTLQSDDGVVVAKMDATANDVPSEFDGCQGYLAMYLVTASGNITAYDGGRAANEIVDFVKKNKETARSTTVPPETLQTQSPPPSP